MTKDRFQPVLNFIENNTHPKLQVFAWVIAWVFLMMVTGIFFAGVYFVMQDIWSAIHAQGEDQPPDVRVAMLVFLALLGAPVVLWRAMEQSRQVSINQESLYTELFTRAVEQLGATKTVWQDVARGEGEAKTVERIQTTERNIEVRLGAIYALERVMKNSEPDAGPIVETLSAYVRAIAGRPKVFLFKTETRRRQEPLETN